MEDSGHAWYLHHLPAPWLPTQIEFGGRGGREVCEGKGKEQSGWRGRERLVGSERHRLPVFFVLLQAVVLIEQGKRTVRFKYKTVQGDRIY